MGKKQDNSSLEIKWHIYLFILFWEDTSVGKTPKQLYIDDIWVIGHFKTHDAYQNYVLLHKQCTQTHIEITSLPNADSFLRMCMVYNEQRMYTFITSTWEHTTNDQIYRLQNIVCMNVIGCCEIKKEDDCREK